MNNDQLSALLVMMLFSMANLKYISRFEINPSVKMFLNSQQVCMPRENIWQW